MDPLNEIIDVRLHARGAVDVDSRARGRRTDCHRTDPGRTVPQPTTVPGELQRAWLYGGRIFHHRYGHGLHAGRADACRWTHHGATGGPGAVHNSNRRASAL